MKALLHICCAPCAVYPLATPFLRAHDITGFFYNPNIHPYPEYLRRRDTLTSFACSTGLEMIDEGGYFTDDFFQTVSGKAGERCVLCYRLRLEKTAHTAKANGFAGFSSTLLYSKYQNHNHIREIGETAAAALGLVFLYDDFRQGWQAGIKTSKEMGLYRQRYCGCFYSRRESLFPTP